MKCQAWVRVDAATEKKRKNQRKAPSVASAVLVPGEMQPNGLYKEAVGAIDETEAARILKGPVRRCGGTIAATVKAQDEAIWGDHYASLSVSYECDLCQGDNYFSLPDKYNISEWLTKLIAESLAGWPGLEKK